MSWNDPPDYQEMNDTSKQLGRIRGLILRVNRDIEKREATLKQDYPRKPQERIIAMEDLLDQRMELQVQEAELKTHQEFLNVRVDMYKSIMYSKR
jgi:predicted alpha/beta superfamily hydrolase